MSDSATNTANTIIHIQHHQLFSQYLERDVLFDTYATTENITAGQTSLLLINDGQDLPKMPFEKILQTLVEQKKVNQLLCVGIHCGEERKREYGTAYSADYLGRGDKAGLYGKFIFDELLPYIRKKFRAPSFKEKVFAGFSLGGLSALDIVWNHASEFTKSGIFSASLWWRRKGYDDGYDDEQDRLMHLQIRKGSFHPWLQFFIQCGALDENEDRNNNGVIDSIDDAMDLIVELKAKGFTDDYIKYVELEDGKHDVASWAKALPIFLEWAFGKEK